MICSSLVALTTPLLPLVGAMGWGKTAHRVLRTVEPIGFSAMGWGKTAYRFLRTVEPILRFCVQLYTTAITVYHTHRFCSLQLELKLLKRLKFLTSGYRRELPVTACTFRTTDRGRLPLCDRRIITERSTEVPAFRVAGLAWYASPYGMHIATRFEFITWHQAHA
jgi:hypothetical protein